MFTGIIEEVGEITKINRDGDNTHLTIRSNISKDAYIDQSISHNGVCLTVVGKNEDTHTVTAIKETLDVTNLKYWKTGDLINLERAMIPNQRLDGHFVQGHVDQITSCTGLRVYDGSWVFRFGIPVGTESLIVHKGSIAINGVSLTVILPDDDPKSFEVAIIPYTYEHTNFKSLKVGDFVNLEYDILGKYVLRYMNLKN